LSTSTIERTGVEQAMMAAGYGSYLQYAGDLTNYLRGRQVTAETVQSYARQRGLTVSYQQAQTFCNTLLRSGTEREVGGTTAAPSNMLTEGFSREHAAAVIREAGREAGVNMSNLEDVLREAGLVDQSDDEDTPPWASGIIERLDRLENAARARGLNI
jgi:hypothetical protein